MYQGKDVRVTIGSPDAWSIPQAQTKARELQRLIDEGTAPRTLKREALAAAVAEEQAQAAAAAKAVTVGEAWAVYLEARRPRWGERHYNEHLLLVKAGGVASRRAPHRPSAPVHLLPRLHCFDGLDRCWQAIGDVEPQRPNVRQAQDLPLNRALRWEDAFDRLLALGARTV